jgi:hypothetical protein
LNNVDKKIFDIKRTLEEAYFNRAVSIGAGDLIGIKLNTQIMADSYLELHKICVWMVNEIQDCENVGDKK